MKFRNIIIGFLLILSSVVYAFEESKVINIGGKYITVSSPYGFHIETDKEVLRVFKSMFPTDKMSLEVFISPNVDDSKHRYMFITTIPQLKSKDLSKKSYKFISKVLVDQQYTLMNTVKGEADKILQEGVATFNDEFDVNAEVSIDEITTLGVFLNKENAISMAVMIMGQFSMDEYSDDTPQIGTVSFLRIKNRLVLAYLYSDYIDSKDVIWVKSKTKELVDLLLKVNN